MSTADAVLDGARPQQRARAVADALDGRVCVLAGVVLRAKTSAHHPPDR
ncbi:hypothetical protein [Streptomyces thioluteus]